MRHHRPKRSSVIATRESGAGRHLWCLLTLPVSGSDVCGATRGSLEITEGRILPDGGVARCRRATPLESLEEHAQAEAKLPFTCALPRITAGHVAADGIVYEPELG